MIRGRIINRYQVIYAFARSSGDHSSKREKLNRREAKGNKRSQDAETEPQISQIAQKEERTEAN